MKNWLKLLEIARENVRKKLQIENVSDYRMAEEMKITRQALSQIKKGSNDIAAVTKLKIAVLSKEELKPLAEQIIHEDDIKKAK